MLDSQIVIDSLNRLIQLSAVEKEYFLSLSDSVADDALSLLCKRRAQEIKKNIYELRKLIYNLGGNPQFSLSFIGFIQSKWKLIRTVVLSYDQLRLVHQITGTNLSLLKLYEKINEKYLPPMVGLIFKRQMDDLRRSVSQCKQLQHKLITTTDKALTNTNAVNTKPTSTRLDVA